MNSIGRIIIVGYLPDFINPEKVLHIKGWDTDTRERNIRIKLYSLYKYGNLAKEFCFMSDDILLLQKVAQFGAYHRYPIGEIAGKTMNKEYKRTLMRLSKVFDYDSKMCEAHYPFVYNSEKLRAILPNITNKKFSPFFRTYYINHYGVHTELCDDFKAFKEINFERDFVSLSDELLSNCVWLEKLYNLFPEKSLWEK